MANYSLSRLERIYLEMQTVFGTIPNSGGTASIGNSNCCRHIRATLANSVGLLQRRDKTGTRSSFQGVVGRKFGTWSVEMSVTPNGSVGVKPDCDPILQSLFSQAPTVRFGGGTLAISSSTNASPIVVTSAAHGLTVGGYYAVTIAGHLINTNANGVWIAKALSSTTLELEGSTGNGVGAATGTVDTDAVEYKLLDQPLLTFDLWSFRSPSTLNQRVGFGCTAQSATFTLGQDVATWNASGECLWVLESDFFSSADTIQKGGLSAFPSEPGAPVTNGGIIAGFTGSCTVNGAVQATIRTATVKFDTGQVTIKDLFGTYYPDSVEADERNVTISFSLYDQDSTGVQNIRNLGNTKTPVDIILQVGTVAGSIMLMFLRGVQLAAYTMDDGSRRFSVTIPDSKAHGSSITARDELMIAFI